MKKITILAATNAPLDDVTSGMQRLFNNECTIDIHPPHSFFKTLSQYDMAVLPDSDGERSPYPFLLSHAADQHLRTYLYNGGQVLAISAGAYALSHSITYRSEKEGRTLQKLGCSCIFTGMAVGPVPRAEAEPIQSGMRAVAATIGMDGETYKIAYGNGPQLFTTLEDRASKILACYREGKHKGPAIMEVPYGRGVAILTGILPYKHHVDETAERTDHFARTVFDTLVRTPEKNITSDLRMAAQ